MNRVKKSLFLDSFDGRGGGAIYILYIFRGEKIYLTDILYI